MKNKIEPMLVLKVYEYIQQHGEAFEQGKLLDGITAFSDYDGYTIYLKGNGALLRFGFHNQYSIDCEDEKLKGIFLDKINAIVKKYQKE